MDERNQYTAGSWRLTCSSLSDLLCRNSEDIEYFDHYLHDDVCHRLRWRNFGIGLETFEKGFNSLEYVDESLLGCTNILSRLRNFESSSVTRCRERYRPGGGRQHLRRSLSQVRKPGYSLSMRIPRGCHIEPYQTNPSTDGS